MGKDTLIDWQLGTQAGFDAAAPLGTRNDELICRRPGVAPLSDWSRNVAPHGQRTRVDDGQSEAARFARLSNTDKLGVALRTTAGAVGPEMGGKLRELISPTNLAIMAGALAIWVGAHATPIGWVVDIGMVGLGVVALGAEAVSVMRELHAFAMGVIKAKSETDLMAAGRHLAKAIAIVGVDVVVAILLKKAIVKVREPGAAAGEAVGGKKLFGKYDPKDAVKSLPAKTAISDTKSASSVKNSGVGYRAFDNFLENGATKGTFATDAKLISHFESHGSEFGAANADGYLKIGRDIMRNGTRVQYPYKGEIRTGYVEFMGNTRRGETKFGFVGMNSDGAITTIHTESGKSFWKMLNGDSSIRNITPAP